MAKSTKKPVGPTQKGPNAKPAVRKAAKAVLKSAAKKAGAPLPAEAAPRAMIEPQQGATAEVLDRLWNTVVSRRDASVEISHSARLLSRGTAKVAQKFGEEAVECLIEAVAGNQEALVGESADVLYHLLVMWVSAGIDPSEVWAELQRREGVSGIAEKASRVRKLPMLFGLRTTKIP